MASRNNGNGNPRPRFDMVNIDFSHNERVEINDWIEHREPNFDSMLVDITENNFKLSFSRDSYHETFVGSLTDKSKNGTANKSSVYIIRHSDITKLLHLVCYFFTVTLQSGNSEIPHEQTQYDW